MSGRSTLGHSSPRTGPPGPPCATITASSGTLVGLERTLALMFVTVFVLLVTEAWGATGPSASYLRRQLRSAQRNIHHVVIIMQENRSFDHYFGTFPGADGIPMQKGAPTVCVPDPMTQQCVRPFHDGSDMNHGGPHGKPNALADIDGGKMDGFIAEQELGSAVCSGTDERSCCG